MLVSNNVVAGDDRETAEDFKVVDVARIGETVSLPQGDPFRVKDVPCFPRRSSDEASEAGVPVNLTRKASSDANRN